MNTRWSPAAIVLAAVATYAAVFAGAYSLVTFLIERHRQ